jgi:hypothetical protein
MIDADPMFLLTSEWLYPMIGGMVFMDLSDVFPPGVHGGS